MKLYPMRFAALLDAGVPNRRAIPSLANRPRRLLHPGNLSPLLPNIPSFSSILSPLPPLFLHHPKHKVSLQHRTINIQIRNHLQPLTSSSPTNNPPFSTTAAVASNLQTDSHTHHRGYCPAPQPRTRSCTTRTHWYRPRTFVNVDACLGCCGCDCAWCCRSCRRTGRPTWRAVVTSALCIVFPLPLPGSGQGAAGRHAGGNGAEGSGGVASVEELEVELLDPGRKVAMDGQAVGLFCGLWWS